MKVAIIGTSQVADELLEGRSKEIYDQAIEEIVDILKTRNLAWDQIELISGGSAWSDHLAVGLYLLKKDEGISLTLYLPASLSLSDRGDRGDKGFSESTYAGRELNKRHKVFSLQVFGDPDRSLSELRNLSKCDRVKLVYDLGGFKARNTLIANNADCLFAFSTTGGTDGLTPGTRDTWRKFSKVCPKAQVIIMHLV